MIPLRLARELIYQLHHAGERDRLAKVLANIPVFMVLYQGEMVYEVLELWVELGSEYDLEAVYRQGLEQWRSERGHERDQGIVLDTVANLLLGIGRWVATMELQRDRLVLAITGEDRSEEAKTRSTLGWLLYLRGEYPQALDELTQAQMLFEELGDRRGLSYAIGYAGVVYAQREEYDQGLKCFEQQEAMCRELGDRDGLLKAISNAGTVYADRGEYDRAMECHREAESMCRELGDRWMLSGAIGNAGIVYWYRGEYDRGLKCFEQQEAMCRELGDRLGLSYAMSNAGVVYQELGEYEHALEYTNRVLQEYRSMGAHALEGELLYDLGLTLLELVEHHRSNALPEFLLKYAPSTEPRHILAQARQHVEESLAIASELGSKKYLFHGAVLQARLEAAEGHRDEAAERLVGMLSEATDDEQRADLHYRLWKLDAGTNGQTDDTMSDRDQHHHEALAHYEKLLAKTPKHEYRKRIEELRQVPLSTS